MNTSRSWLAVAVPLIVLGLACGSSKSGGTTTGAGGPGGSNGTGASGGGSSTGGASSGSASTGGGSGGGENQDPIGRNCMPKSGGTDYKTCSTSADCHCPLLCGLDPVFGPDDAGGSVCVQPCSTTADCPDIGTSCDSHGLCTTNICEYDGGGDFMVACNAVGQNDGTCEPEVDHNDEIFGACFQGGSASLTGGCDKTYPGFMLGSAGNTVRPPPSSLCPVDYQCIVSTSGAICQQLCDPTVDGPDADNLTDGGCISGTCVSLETNTVFGGACSDVGDAGCLSNEGGGELATCKHPQDCECPLICNLDRGSEQRYCETPCTSTADCDQPYLSCQKNLGFVAPSYCNFDYCVANYYGVPLVDAGYYGGPCNYAGQGDGVCQVQVVYDQNGNPINSFGLCQPGGTQLLGQTCTQSFQTPYCDVNTLCVNLPTGPACAGVCDPLSDGGCPPGDGCFSLIPYPLAQQVGVCASPCSPAGAGCVNSPECCDGFCDFSLDAGAGTCN